jgi:hypothetical protein
MAWSDARLRQAEAPLLVPKPYEWRFAGVRRYVEAEALRHSMAVRAAFNQNAFVTVRRHWSPDSRSKEIFVCGFAGFWGGRSKRAPGKFRLLCVLFAYSVSKRSGLLRIAGASAHSGAKTRCIPRFVSGTQSLNSPLAYKLPTRLKR